MNHSERAGLSFPAPEAVSRLRRSLAHSTFFAFSDPWLRLASIGSAAGVGAAGSTELDDFGHGFRTGARDAGLETCADVPLDALQLLARATVALIASVFDDEAYVTLPK